MPPRCASFARCGGGGMFGAVGKRGLRGAIGLIAAYAFALHALLALTIVTQAAAQGSASGSFFVICVTDESGGAMSMGAGGSGDPVKPVTHCPICTLSGAASALTLDAVALPLPLSVAAKVTPFLTAQACISLHEARAGLTRAPPQNA